MIELRSDKAADAAGCTTGFRKGRPGNPEGRPAKPARLCVKRLTVGEIF